MIIPELKGNTKEIDRILIENFKNDFKEYLNHNLICLLEEFIISSSYKEKRDLTFDILREIIDEMVVGSMDIKLLDRFLISFEKIIAYEKIVIGDRLKELYRDHTIHMFRVALFALYIFDLIIYKYKKIIINYLSYILDCPFDKINRLTVGKLESLKPPIFFNYLYHDIGYEKELDLTIKTSCLSFFFKEYKPKKHHDEYSFLYTEYDSRSHKEGLNNTKDQINNENQNETISIMNGIQEQFTYEIQQAIFFHHDEKMECTNNSLLYWLLKISDEFQEWGRPCFIKGNEYYILNSFRFSIANQNGAKNEIEICMEYDFSSVLNTSIFNKSKFINDKRKPFKNKEFKKRFRWLCNSKCYFFGKLILSLTDCKKKLYKSIFNFQNKR